MAEQVGFQDCDGVALVTLNRPPGNALTAELRRAFDAVLATAMQRSDLTAIVICGAGRGFSTGVDISEFDSKVSAPSVRDLCARIEECSKPVVCALQGMALGAGLELALAAHARVAQRDTRLAVEDVKMAMVPGGGATQRLPRLLGAQKSLEMLLTGQTVLAGDASMKRLITQLCDGSPIEPALALARDLATRGTWSKTRDVRTGFSDPLRFQNSVTAVKAQLAGQASAGGAILRCVEAAQLLPFDQGLAFEESLYVDHLSSPEARAARHLLVAQQCAARPPARAKSPTGQVDHVTLIGAGGLIGETALACVEGGLQVSILTPDDASAAQIGTRITQVWADTHADPAQITARRDRLIIQSDPTDLDTADLIFDDGRGAGLPAKQIGPDAVWAALRREVDPARAGALAEVGRELDLHFYRPVHIAQMAELSIPRGTDPQAVATLLSALARIKRVVIQTSLPAGYVGQRLGNALFAAACQLVAHGANPYDVDRAACDLGFATGPFLMMDRIGLDTMRARLSAYADQQGLGRIEDAFLKGLVDHGRAGRASGAGVYHYESDATARDPELPRMVAELTISDSAAEFDSKGLGAALLGAIVNEAMRLMADGAVRRASDLDLLLVRGFGFDAARGGPLLWADLSGLFALSQALQALIPLSEIWRPHPKVVDMIRNGQGIFGRPPV